MIWLYHIIRTYHTIGLHPIIELCYYRARACWLRQSKSLYGLHQDLQKCRKCRKYRKPKESSKKLPVKCRTSSGKLLKTYLACQREPASRPGNQPRKAKRFSAICLRICAFETKLFNTFVYVFATFDIFCTSEGLTWRGHPSTWPVSPPSN